jgi:hypothetical protein
MRIIDRGAIYDNPQGLPTHKSVFGPDVEVLADGRLIAAARVGSGKHSPDGDLLFFESADEGRTWTPMDVRFDWVRNGVPGAPQSVYLSAVAPHRLLMTTLWVDFTDPSLPFFHPETEGLLPVTILIAESDDGGRSWSPFRVVDTSPMIQGACTGPIMALPDGTLLQPFEVHKKYLDRRPMMQKAGVIFSYDGGFTWQDPTVVAHDPTRELFYWDQRHALLPDGSILAIFWTYNNLAARDECLHWSVSRDGGKAWTKPVSTGIPGHPSVPVPLGGDDVLLLSVHRFGEPPCLRALLSRDKGRTWDLAGALVFYEHPVLDAPPADSTADMLQDISLWTFGLCTGRRLPNGDVFCVYYAGDSSQTGAHWVRIQAP